MIGEIGGKRRRGRPWSGFKANVKKPVALQSAGQKRSAGGTAAGHAGAIYQRAAKGTANDSTPLGPRPARTFGKLPRDLGAPSPTALK